MGGSLRGRAVQQKSNEAKVNIIGDDGLAFGIRCTRGHSPMICGHRRLRVGPPMSSVAKPNARAVPSDFAVRRLNPLSYRSVRT